MSGKIIAYRVEPVYESTSGGMATACLMQCAATGRVLSGSGGGGFFLAPEVVEDLLAERVEIPEESGE